MLIIGLGNPGKKYENTRHNAGHKAIDAIAANFQFPIFNFQSISNAQISKHEIDGKQVTLAKPQTFMNNSGSAVKSLIKNYKLKTKNLIVVHDDIDIPLGEFKIQRGRGAAGHKGVQSVINELGAKDFWRIRIGIKPNSKFKSQNAKSQFKIKNLERFVLEKFTKNEQKILENVFAELISEIPDLLISDIPQN